MEKLLIWFYAFKKQTYIPNRYDIYIRENFTPLKEVEDMDYPWVLYNPEINGYPPSKRWALPKELYLIIQRNTKIMFDFLPYQYAIYIVSDLFLNKVLLPNRVSFEMAKLNIVSKNAKKLDVNKNYYAVRINQFDDDLFNFPIEGRKRAAGLEDEFIYPNMQLKEYTTKNVFFIDRLPYSESFIFKSSYSSVIKECYKPIVYAIEDFYLAYNNKTSDKIDNIVKPLW